MNCAIYKLLRKKRRKKHSSRTASELEFIWSWRWLCCGFKCHFQKKSWMKKILWLYGRSQMCVVLRISFRKKRFGRTLWNELSVFEIQNSHILYLPFNLTALRILLENPSRSYAFCDNCSNKCSTYIKGVHNIHNTLVRKQELLSKT